MGQPVIVDSDDLETLLFATGAIKAVEAALKQRKQDPLAKRAEPKLKAAHDRVATAWRGALRPTRLATPLTDFEVSRLVNVMDAADPRLGTPAFFDDALRALREKGCIDVSPMLVGRAWNGSDISWIDEGKFAVRANSRGDEMLAARAAAAPKNGS